MVRTLGGRYRLTDFLASGGTGEVWRALDRGTDRTVAVKLLYPQLATDPRLAERLVRSRGELTALWHPCIARLLDVVVDGDELGLVTDLVPGVDLGRRLAGSRPITAGGAAQIAVAVADALSAAHRLGVVHGDLKPSNVLVPAPEQGPARVTDFAVASLVRSGHWSGQLADTSPYRAPEVTEGASPGASSDVYALGMVLAEMLEYATRYGVGVNGGVDARLRELAAACLAADPGARPSAAHADRELRELLPHLGVAPIEDPMTRAPFAITPRPAVSPPPPARRVPRPRTPRPARQRPNHRRRWFIRTPLRLALVLLAAVGLTAGVVAATRVFWVPQGSAQESPSGSPSAASQTGASAPALPEAARAHTRDGGIEFVKYWFAALTYAARTGDTATLAEATSPDCENCQATMSTIRSAYDAGGRTLGGEYLVRGVTTDSFFTLAHPVFGTNIDRTAQVTVDRNGTERNVAPTLSFASCQIILEWTDNRWRVLEVPVKTCLS